MKRLINTRISGLARLSVLFLAALIFSSFYYAGYAQDLMIIKQGGKLSISLSDLSTGCDSAVSFKSTLASDLERSGWFEVVEQGRAVITVEGTCEEAGNMLVVRCEVKSATVSKRYLKDTFRDENQRVAKLAHVVADEIVWAVKKVKGIASTRIAMVGARGGKKDLYVCDADGGNMTSITSDGMAFPAPAWDPEGNILFYTSRHGHGGFLDVYMIDLRTNSRRVVSAYPGLNAGTDLSADGKKAALTLSKDGNPELYVMHLSNKRIERITRTRYAAEASPSWSPDGRKIVFVSDKSGSPQLYTMNSDGGEQKIVSLRGNENVAPDWGPDGRIVWSSRIRGRYEICVLDPVTGQNMQLTTGDADYEDPSWAPDGRHIVCSRTVGYTSDLYVLDTMGDAPIRLTRLQGDWFSPCWSPK